MPEITSKLRGTELKTQLLRTLKGEPGKREMHSGLSFLRQMERLSSSRLGGRSLARGKTFGRGVFVRSQALTAQIVVVKARVVRRANARNLLNAHVAYITRDGAVDKKSLALYCEKGKLEPWDLNKWLEDSAKDRHHFRVIISPKNACHLHLTAYTKELVDRTERDLGTRLRFIAANHLHTENPHVHLVIRGEDEAGKDLFISRDIRQTELETGRFEIAARELGLRSELEKRNRVFSICAQLGRAV
jgi:hypothetical protein